MMETRRPPASALLARTALAAALVILVALAARVLLSAAGMVGFVLDLDYGEGIVLQQALLVTGPRAYGDITQYPFIVFHYPPVYLLAVNALASFGVDVVTAGRGISVLSALAIAAAVGVLVQALLAGRGDGASAPFGAAVGAFVVFAFVPVSSWVPLARVDMLAVALSLWGLALVPHAPEARWRCYAAALLFTLGVYTKQTTIAAPLAATLLLLVASPRDAVRLVIAGLALSVAILAGAMLLTEGGFLQHLILYNINRSNRGGPIYYFVVSDFILILLGAVGTLAALWHLVGPGPGRAVRGGLAAHWHALTTRLRKEPPARALAASFLYLAVSTPLLALVMKSGSNLNYFIEWACGCALMIGALAGWAARATRPREGRTSRLPHLSAAFLPVLLLAHAAVHTPPSYSLAARGTSRESMEELVAVVRAATKPVISDDMVLLLRAGKEVPWEPAIFAELGTMGRWDEDLIVNLIRSGHFAFAITEGSPGTRPFDARYNPAVVEALEQAFPRQVMSLGLTFRLPADSTWSPRLQSATASGGVASRPPPFRTVTVDNCSDAIKAPHAMGLGVTAPERAGLCGPLHLFQLEGAAASAEGADVGARDDGPMGRLLEHELDGTGPL